MSAAVTECPGTVLWGEQKGILKLETRNSKFEANSNIEVQIARR
jgi:hypothetical protein